jgi:hypothetical protein
LRRGLQVRGAPGAVALVAALAGCGSRSDLDRASAPSVTVTPQCPPGPPTCVADGTGCDPATAVAAVCDGGSHLWRCPAGARLYSRASAAPSPCLPFLHASGLASVGDWGLGGLSQVPTDDGRCLWIAETATLADGTAARNVAFEVDRTAPFGTCPSGSLAPPTPVVTVEGGDDPSLLVQINGGYRLGGSTHVLYRLFRSDATAAFGVTEVGGGVARWDGALGRIVVPSPGKPFPWGLDLDLGDAVLLAGDGSHAYVWGCAGPGAFLLQACKLARLDSANAIELLGKAGDFIASVRASDGAATFDSGPWTSSVVAGPGGFRHVYVGGFGTTIGSHVAASPLGPWSDGPGLGGCDLPAGDAKAFCAGPIVHTDIADPTRAGELPVTYGVGTTGAKVGGAVSYWPRLVWAQ